MTVFGCWLCGSVVCVLVYTAAYRPHDTGLDHCYPHCMGKGMKIQEGYFLQAGFPAAALLSFGVRYTIFRCGGWLVLCGVLSCFPVLYPLATSHTPQLWQPSVTQMWPNAPPRVESPPIENHWLNISLVIGRGGLWNRCVTPRARHSFLVTPATFRRMKKQGRDLIPWR